MGEPAFSCYIEAEDARVLLDVGYSDVFLRNAEKMGIDLSALTHVVLSHGHNDHTGGLTPFIEEKIAPSAKLIAHEDCFVGKYYGEEYIGAPYDVEQILYLADCQLTAEPVAITENLWYLGEIPRKLDFEPRTVIGKRERMGAWEEDDLLDDTALAYRTENGLFIITGCAHSGICNIIEQAKAVCGDDRIIGVLGGFHLFEDDDRAAATAAYPQIPEVARTQLSGQKAKLDELADAIGLELPETNENLLLENDTVLFEKTLILTLKT